MLDIIKQHDIGKYRLLDPDTHVLPRKYNVYIRFRNGNKLWYLWTMENDEHYYVMWAFRIPVLAPVLKNGRPYKKLSLALTRLQEFLEQ